MDDNDPKKTSPNIAVSAPANQPQPGGPSDPTHIAVHAPATGSSPGTDPVNIVVHPPATGGTPADD